jgi:hypothetical protein
MCETSKRPAPVRTATCSSRMPRYCTGMSHPAKGTSLARRAAWRPCSGVCRRVSVVWAKSPEDVTNGSGGGRLGG